jgi:uracil-DNA glycosylase family 4
MTFIPMPAQRIIPGEGDKDAKICIIGEAGGAHEHAQLRPFVGPAGTVLDQCLHAAQLTRRDCYVTNVVKVKPSGNDIAPYFKDTPKGYHFTPAGQEWVDILYEELKDVRSNVLVPLGKVALAACTGYHRISQYRGYVCKGSTGVGGRKVIPAYHPAASLRGQYLLRYYITADLQKAKVESAFPEIRRPQRNIIVPTTLEQCTEWLDYLDKQGAWGCDIEVVNFEVSAIGFAPTASTAISIPMYHEHWSLEEEAYLWMRINRLLTSKALKIFQNGIFDVHFLANRCGIHVAQPIEDTMIAHSVQYPELLKGLGFLVSIHCGAQEYYKDMVKFNNIKEEA